MKNKIKKILVLKLVVVNLAMMANAVVYADDKENKKFSPLVYFSLSTGGEDMATFETVAGDERDLRAGGLLSFGAGVRALIPEYKNLIVDGTIGYKFDSIEADNGDEATMSRFILNVIPYYTSNNIRFGVGVTAHFNNTYEDNFSASIMAGLPSRTTTEIDFGPDVGLVVDFGLSVGDLATSLGLRLTRIDYSVETFSVSGLGSVSDSDLDMGTADGNSIEFYILHAF